MLNPNNDRLDYGQILASPSGFELDFAIGTTYSLDLDALVGASLALGLSEETDSLLMNNPVCLLEALRSTGDKVALFCENAQIHMPSRRTALYILLEKMVFVVKMAKHGDISTFPSFHPKLWLIRYRSVDRKVLYRIVILSRNLTFDRSWDVTYYMDGKLREDTTDKNKPICDFLRFLLLYVPGDKNGREKSGRIQEIISELPYVFFEPTEKEFRDYSFIPNGIKRADGSFYRIEETSLFRDTYHELLIISPFLSSGIIRNFNNRNNSSLIKSSEFILITRRMSLGKLKPEDVTHFRLFVMRDEVIDGETAISEGASSGQKQDIHDDSKGEEMEDMAVQRQDIHAKVYLTRKNYDSALYLGSLNASHNAVYGNIEFMICLHSKKKYMSADSLIDALFDGPPEGPNNPFQEITLEDMLIGEEDPEAALNAVIKNISRSHPTALVTVYDEEQYGLSVHFDLCDTQGMKIVVRPLLSNKEALLQQDVEFTGLSLVQLSEFFAVTVTDGDVSISRVLIIPTEGLPENREQAVVTSIVSDSECFYRYVAFLLGDDSVLSVLEMKDAENDKEFSRRFYRIPALYEKMLRAAATEPQKFRGIAYLMKTIREDGIIPEEFKMLYKKFMNVVKING